MNKKCHISFDEISSKQTPNLAMASEQNRSNGDLHLADAESKDSGGLDNPAYTVTGDEKAPPEVVVVDGSQDYQNKADKSPVESLGTDDEVEKARQENRDREPLKFCKFVCNYPKLSFALTLFGHILFLLITLILVRVGYDIIPITFDRIPLDIVDHPDYLRELAWNNRMDKSIITRGMGSDASEVTVQPERSETTEFLELIFKSKSGNVFTKENLLKVKQVEDDFFNNEEYQSKFCKLNSLENGSCDKPTSIIRYFDGSYSSMDPALNDPSFDNIPGVLNAVKTNVGLNNALQYHLGANSEITPTSAVSDVTRVLMFIGGPLKDFVNTTHDKDEQETLLKRFMFDTIKPIGDKHFKNDVGEMEFTFSSVTLISVTITSTVVTDMLLAVGSLVFIMVFMEIQTGSFWVSGFSVLSIITGFTCANLIYRVVFDYRYFGIFHVLALFIILGIGADDVFVFFDTWKETAHHKYKSLAHRLSDCYRKASIAMLFTSLTTAVAFIVSATSPFLGVWSFGVFAGLLVCVNYISVIVFFPTVVVTYHLFWEKYRCCCCCVKNNVQSETTPPTSDDGKRKHAVVRFFRGPYFRFVTHKIGRWCILAFFAIIIAVFAWSASQLKVNEEQIKFLKDSSSTGRYLAWRSLFTARGSEAISVELVWGLKQQDLSTCHRTDASCTGVTVRDDSLKMNDASQEALLVLCNKLKNLPQNKLDEMAIRKDLNTDEPEITCFMQDMQAFTIPQLAHDVPYSLADMNNLKSRQSSVYGSLSPEYTNAFELEMSYWLYNGFFMPGWTQMRKYGDLIGETETPYTKTTQLATMGGMDFTFGTKLSYIAISVNTTISGMSIGYPKGLPIRNAWEDFMTNELTSMPPALKGGFQTTSSGLWHWLKVQETLTSSAVLGIGIGLAVAFPILTIATHNIIIGLLATLTICCITACVVGVIPMAGWKLGLLESLNLVLVVGLAVDYVVHLAEGYSRSLHNDRRGRVHDMLEEVGISVLSGACTTLGASFFLLFAQILFFTQFAVFMFSTIGFSILFALGMFVTVMGVIGPEGETGSLKPFYRWCARTCCNGCCKKE